MRSKKFYAEYRRIKSSSESLFEKLTDILRNLGCNKKADELTHRLEGFREIGGKFSVGVIGEMMRGMSTLVDALLGEVLAPASVVPTTETLSFIESGDSTHAVLHLKDGETPEIPIDNLSEFVTGEAAHRVDYISLTTPADICKNGVVLIDTPGLGNKTENDKEVMSIIPILDAYIMTCIASAPLGQNEVDFLCRELTAAEFGRLILVVNKSDFNDGDENKRLAEAVKEKVKRIARKKLAAIYNEYPGEDTAEYKAALDALDGIAVLLISAKEGLEGKLEHDASLIDDSHISDLEAETARHLVREVGTEVLLDALTHALSAADICRLSVVAGRASAKMALSGGISPFPRISSAIASAYEKKTAILDEFKRASDKVYNNILKVKADRIYGKIADEFSALIHKIRISEHIGERPAEQEHVSELFTQAAVSAVGNVLAYEFEKAALAIERVKQDALSSAVAYNKELAALTGRLFGVSSESSSKGSTDAFRLASDIYKSTLTARLGGESDPSYLVYLPGIGGKLCGSEDNKIEMKILAQECSECFDLAFSSPPKNRDDAVKQGISALEASLLSLKKRNIFDEFFSEKCRVAFSETARKLNSEWDIVLSTLKTAIELGRTDAAASPDRKALILEKLSDTESRLSVILSELTELVGAVRTIAGDK